MARFLPNKLSGAISPETAKLGNAFRRIPGEELVVWIALPLGAEWRPEIMAIHRRERCLLIAVSKMTEGEVEAILHGDLFASPGDTTSPADVEKETRQKLREFFKSCLAAARLGTVASEAMTLAVAFPNVPQHSVDELVRRGKISDCQFWGKESVRSEGLAHKATRASEARVDLPESLVDALRARFSPEIGIPDSLVARIEEEPRRNSAARLTGLLLDLDQEYLAKEDLALSAEADAVVDESRLRLVTGVAGSGKSLILLYRAMLQARMNPQARLLILTHNRPLIGELHERFRRLCPVAEAQWQTFYQWCSAFSGIWWDIIPARDREGMLRELAAKESTLARFSIEFLADELDWIRDHGFVSRDQYLAAQRVGRKRRLMDDHRHAIFSLLEKYVAELRRRRQEDWPGAAVDILGQLQAGKIKTPTYDFVFVDEAQFFAPVWFQIVRRSIRPETGRLFLAADPTQGFLKRRQSWIAGGLDVRGNAVRLRRSYRNTREILQFATAFYKSRLADEEEEINLPEESETEHLKSGEAPRLIPVDSPQGERSRVANEIAAALKGGANPEHFLVLFSDSRLVDDFIETLNRTMGRTAARDLKDTAYSATEVKVSSLNAATGLECPVVFLCGLDGLLEAEGGLHLSPEERSELVRDNTRRIYMGMTRASRKLIIPFIRQRTREIVAGVAAAPSASPVSPEARLETVRRAGTPYEFTAGLELSPPEAERYVRWAPVYDLEAAAGEWGPGMAPQEIGWKILPGERLRKGMFVARVKGHSMEPRIPSGSWCLFKPSPEGSRNGRILLVQLHSTEDADCGGRYTVKKYRSVKIVNEDGWGHEQIQLLPLNSAFQPIEIHEDIAPEILVVGEFVSIVGST